LRDGRAVPLVTLSHVVEIRECFLKLNSNSPEKQKKANLFP
jgi:hypothetical protein